MEDNQATTPPNIGNGNNSMEVDENVIRDPMDFEVQIITPINETPASTDARNENLFSTSNENYEAIPVEINPLQITEIAPAENNSIAPKAPSNKNFTLPYRTTGCNTVYQPLIYIQMCNDCTQKITDKSKHLSWECLNFCNEDCLANYQRKIGKLCANCNSIVTLASLGKYCVRFGSDIRQFCQSKCLDAFKKNHKICYYCQTFIIGEQTTDATMIDDQNQFKDFCTQQCMEKYYKMNGEKSTSTALCDVCNNEKLVRIEIEVDNQIFQLCSEPCFVAFKFANNVVTEQCTMCRKYYEQLNTLKYTLFLPDQQIVNFCSKTCQNIYIITNRKIVACDWCKVKKYNFDMIQKQSDGNQKLTVCSFNCLALCKLSMTSLPTTNSNVANVSGSQAQIAKSHAQVSNTLTQHAEASCTHAPFYNTRARLEQNHHQTKSRGTSPIPIVEVPKYIRQIIIKPPPVVEIKNKSTMCKPNTHTKGVSFKPLVNHKETQTEKEQKSVIIPVPVPIYVPMPAVSVGIPFPIPVPFPLPIPVPIFIPTTRNSAQGILKEIQKIQVRLPSDPFEAELLMMAEMVADDKRVQTDSENEEEETLTPLPVIGDDILQMAFNMTTNESVEEPHEVIDLEGALITNTITVSEETEPPPPRPSEKSLGKRPTKSKKDMTTMEIPLPNNTPQDYDTINDGTICDTHMWLKYTFGVNAWKQWYQMKQNDLEKQSSTNQKFLAGRYVHKMKSDPLHLSADELNYSLSSFIKEIRKPNNTQYAPDTIYYLCLGIQYYLYKHNRCDNIFTDIFYEKFTECLNEIAKMFSVLYNDSHYIVTRVEEEHLWECKQLGAHSPHVLLNTLVYFNTKYFNLVTVEDHMQLSFSHIMKHWKRNHSNISAKNSGRDTTASSLSRNVLLRYYPPKNSSSKSVKKVYEQEENERNPLRCPVKLYEFYLSKCPESVKTRNDMFYLSPERSCLPDSPVWYSTLPLDRHALEKMLYRVKMVKEINIAILRA
ncbi:zinc finger MYM-type protein 3-like [Chrysoperla carnea]|uniref:zinc finger MYM-type protein 3-like n=1 Tax=Chrysoperla carnea TaxID=189513 RepID=UPI001D07C5FF|nr:zinc finger MYM-type protein 3-like [Chrysoperla carnea]